MNPAYSIIFFTTASGAGYGLLALLGLGAAGGALPADRWFGLAGLGLSLDAISAGVLSSTFHLGHPERAWRAVTQWRSSWLSREGVASLATYLPAGLLGIGWVFLQDTGGIWAVCGVLAALGAAATVYCTAMIYRSLQAIPRWHQPLVPPVYLLLALATGATWLDLLLGLFSMPAADAAALALLALAAAGAAKLAYWRAIDRAPATATAESATGLGHLGEVRLLDAPHTEANYLMKEMGYRIARKHAAKLRRIAFLLAFAAPAVLLALQLLAGSGPAGAVLAVLAALSMSAGVVVERWLFFAEAQHLVTLYYGAAAA